MCQDCCCCCNETGSFLLQLSLEEYEKNYQRFAREHLELERRFALIQSGHSVPSNKGNNEVGIAPTE